MRRPGAGRRKRVRFMDTYLAVSALGADRAGLVDEISRAVAECGCNIDDSRMTMLGTEFALIMLLSGNWNAIAKVESALPRLAETLELSVHSRRTSRRRASGSLVPYGVEVVAVKSPAIVREVARFFARRQMGIEDLHTSTYPAPHTGAEMFSLHMTVSVPSETPIAALRGEFMDFCDDLNLDGMLAPVK